MNRTQTALKNARRFTDFAVARQARDRQIGYQPPILLGDDGRYWVAATNREASLLNKAGYEFAE